MNNFLGLILTYIHISVSQNLVKYNFSLFEIGQIKIGQFSMSQIHKNKIFGPSKFDKIGILTI